MAVRIRCSIIAGDFPLELMGASCALSAGASATKGPHTSHRAVGGTASSTRGASPTPAHASSHVHSRSSLHRTCSHVLMLVHPLCSHLCTRSWARLVSQSCLHVHTCSCRCTHPRTGLLSHTCASLHSTLAPEPTHPHFHTCTDTLVHVHTRVHAHPTLKPHSPAVGGSGSRKPWGGTGGCCQVLVSSTFRIKLS